MEEEKTRFLREIIIFVSWCRKTGTRHRWCTVSCCSCRSKHLHNRYSGKCEFTIPAVRVPFMRLHSNFVSAEEKFKES